MGVLPAESSLKRRSSYLTDGLGCPPRVPRRRVQETLVEAWVISLTASQNLVAERCVHNAAAHNQAGQQAVLIQ